jgi:transcriptional regulator of heat shock response
LATVKPLSTAERRAIETFLEGAIDLDDVVKRSAKLLADITKQVAVVKYPNIGDSHGREMMAISGTANLARSGEDLGATLSPILEVLLRLLSDAHSTVHVTIGSEQADSSLQTTSLVTVGYGSDASLGILGPTRMDYASSIAAVSTVARYVGRFITEGAK